ncbi:MAG TPA: DnaA N-terminal domain-containing protein, partial [Ktedonobacterales bacterium]|nr:DnaA N-terminal domain-containing protein [Ktedonobacterales bacterium]
MEAIQVWQAALERVRRRVSPSAFATWFGETVGVELRQRRLTVAVPSTFAEDHLRQRFGELARIAVSEVIGERAEIAFVVRPPQGKTSARQTQPSGARGTSRRDASAPGTAAQRVAPAASAGASSGAARAALAQQVAAVYEPRPAPTPSRAAHGRSGSARRR